MILISRIVTALILGIAGYQLGDNTGLTRRLPSYAEIALNFGLLIVIGIVAGWTLGGLLGKLLQRSLSRINERASSRSGSELVVGAIGLILGLVVSALLSIPVSRLEPIGTYLLLPLAIVLAWFTTTLAMARHREILDIFGVHDDDDVVGAPSKLIDTSALIDGRIADIARAGFLEGDLVVPMFVLEELQHIADSDDDVRRARGRRGLDVVTKLRKARRLTTTDEDPAGIAAVDAKLVRLAYDNGWKLVTNDLALSKVAGAQAIPCLNVNELANALKPEFVPGEQVRLKIVRPGKEAGQGVGYLDDGTMVIVDGASERIGETVDAEVSSLLQSPTGKLVFSRLEDAAAGS